MSDIILEARGLTTILGGKAGFLQRARPETRAVDDINLQLHRGETLGLVGESGCGKTTLGRTLLGLLRETAGEISLEGRRVDGLAPKAARRARRAIQYLHQDAVGALDPWWSIGRTLSEAHELSGTARDEGVIDRMLGAVGLDLAVKAHYPHQLSGGQLRRVALARIMLLAPKVVILDEPTAGLDLSIQAAVLRLLQDVKTSFQLTNLFISHDMSVVRLMCDRVSVMYRGRIVESGLSQDIFAAQRHPYTRALVAATPRLSTRAPPPALQGDPPALGQDIPGCAFHPRCPFAVDLCRTQRPVLEQAETGSNVACHRWRELAPVNDNGGKQNADLSGAAPAYQTAR
jgi:oligopeptide/dipeptide ABC transporter ATP-binding protein